MRSQEFFFFFWVHISQKPQKGGKCRFTRMDRSCRLTFMRTRTQGERGQLVAFRGGEGVRERRGVREDCERLFLAVTGKCGQLWADCLLRARRDYS